MKEISLDIIMEMIKAERLLQNLEDLTRANSEKMALKIMNDIQQMYYAYKDNIIGFRRLTLSHFTRELFEIVPCLMRFKKQLPFIYDHYIKINKARSRAGAILFSEDRQSVLLVQAWKSKVWSFPRGKVEAGESLERCACREVDEELSFDIKSLINRKDCVKVNNTTLFRIHNVSKAQKFQSRTNDEIRRICWFDIHELSENENRKKFHEVYEALTLDAYRR